ncbi:phosphatidylinositol-glycan biosynthesis class F protein [Trachemys scripta elegans]|uniref:Phosphatidylinositol glycan anchor biosynthesis class F n=1 Tax=Chrysemys picta bellii TaxID=8478 RepID=A0A8C3H8B0_CHRPI|nr:phosphatidylinositol-glycan biosynthesis class F protein [Chrysemys picta bellii]XP_034620310.1 phosphatidylinositol-glycan biosynthesis class F protein [Trachemys scripta elegans]XP_034620311.1 phosphatidylinositol-glycan biosynthesis class F protein [Trachemys scripta elegans]XP_042711102.1 phosphatidylinositol-glycan biosynthesis class F protein [Chrysemys picta bellii]XP_053880545.1 phosphatidylinositol-glycan biosynthesis class F protein [Malaclemys terrapin pileata]
MKDTEIKRLLSAHIVSVLSIILTTIVPPLFLENFSVLGTHLIWLCICSICVTTVNIILYIILKPNPSSKRISFAHKVTKFLKCCVFFFISCILFHGIIVLYGAPLIESVLETFLFAVLLSTFTTLHCLCMLGPNIQAWIRVFSKNGAMSIWDNSLQITTMCSIVGAWLGAFPIPLDWDRPWQIWPISCSLGATFGYVAGLIIAPLWIYWNRKQLTYKSR